MLPINTDRYFKMQSRTISQIPVPARSWVSLSCFPICFLPAQERVQPAPVPYSGFQLESRRGPGTQTGIGDGREGLRPGT